MQRHCPNGLVETVFRISRLRTGAPEMAIAAVKGLNADTANIPHG